MKHLALTAIEADALRPCLVTLADQGNAEVSDEEAPAIRRILRKLEASEERQSNVIGNGQLAKAERDLILIALASYLNHTTGEIEGLEHMTRADSEEGTEELRLQCRKFVAEREDRLTAIRKLQVRFLREIK